jgi:AcrR family transcriptional regulator
VVSDKLSRATVAEHALKLADTEGLDSVTTRRLAQELGVTPMALYWHFKNKDELLDGVADHLLRAVALPEDDSADWAERLRATVAALVAALRPHRALAPLIQPRVLVSDAGLALVEHSLALLAAAGFTPEEAAELSGHILAAAVTLVTAEPGTGGGVDDAAVRAKRASLLSLAPGRFPHVVAAAEPLTWCANGDAYYARGVDLLVAGVRGLRA